MRHYHSEQKICKENSKLSHFFHCILAICNFYTTLDEKTSCLFAYLLSSLGKLVDTADKVHVQHDLIAQVYPSVFHNLDHLDVSYSCCLLEVCSVNLKQIKQYKSYVIAHLK